MAFIETLTTGFGYWDPLMWVAAFVFAIALAYILRLLGEEDSSSRGDSGAPYLSGNAPPTPGDVHIRAGNLYWGFTEALKGYYSRVIPLHTGDVTDYLLWFVGTIAVILLIMVVVP